MTTTGLTATGPGTGTGRGAGTAGNRAEEPVARNSMVLSVFGLANRAVTVVTQMLLAGVLGASIEADAYFATEPFVDLSLLLVSGGLSMTAIPIYRRIRAGEATGTSGIATGEDANDDRQAALDYLGTVTVASTVVFLITAAAFSIGAPWIVRLAVPGLSPEAGDLTVRILRIMVLVLALIGPEAGLRALLHSNRSFVGPELARFLYNATVLAAVHLYADSAGPTAIAWGMAAGTVAMVGLGVMWAWHLGLLTSFALRDTPDVRRSLAELPSIFVILAWPLLLMFLDRSTASMISVGALSSLGYATRVLLIPIGVIVLPFAIASFPSLADRAVTEDREAMARSLTDALRTLMYVTVPVAVLIGAARFEVIEVLFERGAFGPDDTARTARALAIYALALPGLALVFFLRNAFFAVGAVRSLAAISAGSLALSWLLNVELHQRLGLDGVVLGTAMVATAAAAAMVARLRWGCAITVGVRVLAQPLCDCLVIAGALGVAAAWIRQVMVWVRPDPGPATSIVLWLMIGAAYGLAYVRLTRAARHPDAIRTWDAIANRAEPLRTLVPNRLRVLSSPLWPPSDQVAGSAGRRGGLLVSLAVAPAAGLLFGLAAPRLAGLEPVVLGAVFGAGVFVWLALRRYDAMVFLVAGLLGVAFIEPAPVDLLLAGLIPIGLLTGRVDLDRLPSPRRVNGPVIGFTALGFVAATLADVPVTSVRFALITAYCVGIAYFVVGYATGEREGWVLASGYTLGALLNAVAVVGAFQGPLPIDRFAEFDRARGLTDDANVFGPYLIPAVILLIDDTWQASLWPRVPRWAKGAAIVACLYAIMLTGSRAAWANTVFTVAVYGWLNRHRVTPRQRMLLVVQTMGAGAGLLGLMVVTGQGAFLASRASVLQSYDTDRFTAQREGIEFGLSNLFGIGPGMTDVGSNFAPHNSLIRALAETGVAGLACLLVLLVVTLVPGLRAGLHQIRLAGIPASAVAAVTLGQVANSLVIDTVHWRHFWFLLGLLWLAPVSLPALAPRPRPPVELWPDELVMTGS